jgi:hypothetical protein
MARIMPIALIRLGVRWSLCAVLASVMSSAWTCCFSFVSMLASVFFMLVILI